jgi:hypothetical protein
MSEPENAIPDSSEEVDLKQQCADLRRQTNLLRIGLVVVSVTLTAFLGLQGRRAAKDLEVLRKQANQYVEANKKEGPAVQTFAAKLLEYGKTHPDFVPILNKYGIRPGTNAVPPLGASPAPSSAPAPLR